MLNIMGGSRELQSEVSLLTKNKKNKGDGKLTLNFRGLKNFSDKTQLHFNMLSNTCIFQKRLISLIVGFVNYLGKEKFSNLNTGEAVTLPNSNCILIKFPKILDNPDICEHFLDY